MATLKEKIIEIIFKYLESGKNITERILAEKLNISRTPIREILKELEITGVIERSKGTGIKLHKIELKEIIEIWDARSVLEGMCARMATLNMKDRDIKELEELSHEYLESNKGSIEIDKLFHNKIIELANNSIVKRIIENFSILDMLYLSRDPSASKSTKINYPYPHHMIVKAFKEGNSEKAEWLVKAHIQHAKKRLVESIMATKFDIEADNSDKYWENELKTDTENSNSK